MPYPNYHSCRLRDPNDFEDDSFFTQESEIDGKKVKPKEVAKAFLAFAALKGEHTFKLSFRPRGLAAGFAITALSLAVFALLCIIKLLSRRKG